MHSAHSVGHAVRCRTCSHIVWVQSSARTASGSYRKILFAAIVAKFFVRTGYRMLKSGGVGRIAGYGNINVFCLHNGNAFSDVIGTVTSYLCPFSVRISDFSHHLKFAAEIVILGLNVSKSVNTRYNHSCVLTQSVKNYSERILANFVCRASYADCTFRRSKAFVSCQETKARGLFVQKHGRKVTMS